MTDKELLGLAAKAAGIDVDPCVNGWDECYPMGWNPLIDDGDALRLVVKLHIAITYPFGEDAVRVWYGHEDTDPVCEPLGGDPYAATSRAIVRAAAEVEKIRSGA